MILLPSAGTPIFPSQRRNSAARQLQNDTLLLLSDLYTVGSIEYYFDGDGNYNSTGITLISKYG